MIKRGSLVRMMRDIPDPFTPHPQRGDIGTVVDCATEFYGLLIMVHWWTLDIERVTLTKWVEEVTYHD